MYKKSLELIKKDPGYKVNIQVSIVFHVLAVNNWTME